MIVRSSSPIRYLSADLGIQTAVYKYGQEALCYRETAKDTNTTKQRDMKYSYSHANAINAINE